MNIRHTLLVAGTTLALGLTATATPVHEAPAESRLEHLETAARLLAEAGMMDESTRLRVQAAAIRRDLRQGQIAELGAMIEHLRQENKALQERIAQLEAEARPRVAKPQADPDLEQLAAKAHQQQTEATWAAIKRAARGPRPLPAAPPDQQLQLEPPRPQPPAIDKVGPSSPKHGDQAILEQILKTLQRIEQKIAN